jgi:outer membrane protein OmpA-like peptidoglycan-associated protein
MKKYGLWVLVVLLVVAFAGCSSMSSTQKGAVIGAASGGAVGAVIGNQAGNTAVGAILGAAIGGAAGAYIGNYMDKQAEEIAADIEGAKVERVGEGIKITFDSGLLFAFDKSDLTETSKANLSKLGTILNKYPDTEILLEGHTDAVGSDEYNMSLSQRRSQAVANHLQTIGVLPTRFTVMAYGETQPVATNDTEEGRALNRRVEVAIFANDKLKKAAEEKASG